MAELRKITPVFNKPVINNTAFQHAGKHFDFVLGIDFHWTVTPLNWIPLPLPHAFVGIIFDVMDYIHFSIPVPSFLQAKVGATSIPMGGSVYVHGRHKATTTTSVMGVAIPWAHLTGMFPIYFIVDKPLAPHEGEVYYGSPSVFAQGVEMGGDQPQHVLTCWSPPMGLKPLPTMPNKIKKNPLAYFALYSRFLKIYLQINTGAPVLVGGTFQPHQYTIGEYLMRFAGMAIMRTLTKAIGKGFSGGLRAINNKGLKPHFGNSNKLSKFLCKYGFEPVNFVTGEMVFEWDDFEILGNTILKSTSNWQSASPFPNMFGKSVFNSLDLAIIPGAEKDFAVWKHPKELIPVHIPYMEAGEEPLYFRQQKIWIERPTENTWTILHEQTKYTYQYFNDPEFDDIYRVTSIEENDGTNWYFEYRSGRYNLLSLIKDNAGRKLHFEPHANQKNIGKVYYQYRDEFDLLVSYEYDAAGNVTHVYDRQDKAIQFVYNDDNKIVKRINRNGMEYWWRYDKQGRVVETSGVDGFQHGQLVYHTEEGYNEIIYPETAGKIEKIYYDENSLIDYEVNALGGETWYEHNAFNERKMIASPEGRTIGYEYDEWGNIATMHTADGEQITYSYNATGQLLKRTDAAGISEEWEYDESGRLVSYITKNGIAVQYFYHQNARLPYKAVDSTGLETTWEYNNFGQPTATANNQGMQRQWAYDNYGRLLRQTENMETSTHWKRDDMGRVKAIYEPGQKPLKIKYDAYDLPVYATDGREEWHMEYTPMGSLKRQLRQSLNHHKERGELSFTYDDYENLMAIRNEKGEVYSFIRNGNDEVTKEIGFDGQQKKYLRNADGLVTRSIQHDNKEVFYDYDLAGRLVYTSYDDGSWESFEYDKNGLLAEAANPMAAVTFKRNALGLITEEQQEHGHSIKYTYDAQGTLLSLASSLGAKVDYGYDNLGYLQQVTARAGNTGSGWQMQLQRQMQGRVQKRSFTGGVESTIQYDHTGAPVSQQVTAGQKHLYGRQYTWGDGMRLANTLNTLTGDSVNYNYDTFGSLKAATYNDKETLYKNPDAAGNLYRSKDRSDRVYGHGGKLLKDREWLFYYDAQGNLVLKTKFITIEGQEPLWRQGDWAYEWYANGMLKNVRRPDGGLVSFEYDALGRRTAKIVTPSPAGCHPEPDEGCVKEATVYRYIWDGNVLLHEWSYSPGQRPKLVVNEDGTMAYDKEEPVEGVVTWVYERGSYVPCAKIVGEEKYSIISDYLGRPVQAYDADGKVAWQADYDIYGKPRSLKGAKSFIPFRQLGQYEDEEVALYYNRFRYYDSGQGNYISQDPIGLEGGNLSYGFVKDNNFWVDLFGLSGFYNPITWDASTNGTGYIYTVYQQEIDWDKVDPKTGKTNLELASKGRAPLGADNKPINLHHSKQKAHGPLFELSGGTHSKYGHSNALHPYRVTPNPDGSKFNPFDPVNRELFDKDRTQYWKDRAKTEKVKRSYH